MPTSQITEYLGRDGFSSNTPFRNLATKGCSPNVRELSGLITADKADRAVLMAL